MNFIQLQVTDYNITLLLKLRYILLFKSFSILFFFVKLKKQQQQQQQQQQQKIRILYLVQSLCRVYNHIRLIPIS